MRDRWDPCKRHQPVTTCHRGQLQRALATKSRSRSASHQPPPSCRVLFNAPVCPTCCLCTEDLPPPCLQVCEEVVKAVVAAGVDDFPEPSHRRC